MFKPLLARQMGIPRRYGPCGGGRLAEGTNADTPIPDARTGNLPIRRNAGRGHVEGNYADLPVEVLGRETRRYADPSSEGKHADTPIRSREPSHGSMMMEVVWVLASADGVVFDTLRPNYTGPPQTSHTLLTLPRWPGSGLMSRSLSKAGNISSLFVRGNEGDFLNEHGAVVFWLNHVESYHVAEEFHCGLLAPVALVILLPAITSAYSLGAKTATDFVWCSEKGDAKSNFFEGDTADAALDEAFRSQKRKIKVQHYGSRSSNVNVICYAMQWNTIKYIKVRSLITFVVSRELRKPVKLNIYATKTWPSLYIKNWGRFEATLLNRLQTLSKMVVVV
ncbi:hypothetical protein AK812_SmicGene11867 [Symbiodinium microadriaticum]|uniref:Uncharacterized protein n=1 Tax=Symbiodinium microadriaticum TaxID=2951 RepID=A0A1Q9EC32_SYMMI|nr:hypothetical protein AK812_SmicGene11867 [Symbiodinium microadriaticum]